MRRLLASALLWVGCGPASVADFTLFTNRSAIDGRAERAVIEIDAIDERGAPGSGVVELVAGVGTFVEGPQITLVSGKGSATYRCSPLEDAACSGSIRIGAAWKGVNRSITLRVTPSDTTVRPLWKAIPTLQNATLYAAALSPDQTVWAVGEHGLVLPFTLAHGWGTPVASGVGSTLRALAIEPDGALTIVGDNGVVLRGPPKALRPVVHTLGGITLSSVLVHRGLVYAGTPSGGVASWDVNDFVLEAVSRQAINSLAPLGNTVVAVGDDGMFQTTDGHTWTSLAAPVLARWVTARVDSDGLWALGKRLSPGADPVLVRGPGPDWKSTALPQGNVQAMAWGLGTADRYVVTDTSVFRQQLSSDWQDLEAPSGGRAIVMLGGPSVLVVGQPGISLLRVR